MLKNFYNVYYLVGSGSSLAKLSVGEHYFQNTAGPCKKKRHRTPDMQCCAGIIVCTQDYVYTGRTFRGRSVLVLYTYCCTTVVWCCMCSGLCVHGPKI